VLVVGFGNSGGEIAIDLVEHGAATEIAVRSPVNVIEPNALPKLCPNPRIQEEPASTGTSC